MRHGEKNLKESLKSDRNPDWHMDAPAAQGGGAGPGGDGIHLYT